MDPALLEYYNEELRHLREVAGEFAQEYPKVAGKLGLEQFECADPYVERLLEGFAFMAARVRLKLDAEFPQFTEELLRIVYPDYLAPLPSAVVVEFAPDPNEGGLASGFRITRGTALRSAISPGQQTACEFQLAHDVDLYPLVVEGFDYLPTVGAIATLGVKVPAGVRSGLRLRFMTTAGIQASDLDLTALKPFLRGGEGIAGKLYELLTRDPRALAIRNGVSGAITGTVDTGDFVSPLGFADDEAMLPDAPASFEGYRILREYFLMPERFLFVKLSGFGAHLKSIEAPRFEVIVLLGSHAPELEGIVSEANVALFAVPAINLFSKRADRINISGGEREYHVVADRARPLDFEIFGIEEVKGHLAAGASEQVFTPMYQAAVIGSRAAQDGTHYTVRRTPRVVSSGQRRRGPRSAYIGSEVYLSLVDSEAPPVNPDLQQLSVHALCTNRDLPLAMVVGRGATDFSLESGAPVESVKVIAGPTRPQPAQVHGEAAWRLINHLSLNYSSIAEFGAEEGALPLRRLLALYADADEPHVRRMLEAVVNVSTRPVVRRIGPIANIVAARGLEVTIVCDESGYAGTGLFLFGAVLERFIAKYASINSFTETVIRNTFGMEVMRWPARTGLRRLL